MNIIFHPPDDPAQRKELEKRLANLHAEAVIEYLNCLNCPDEQKAELIERLLNQPS